VRPLSVFRNTNRPVLCSISTDGNISDLGQEYVAAWPPDLKACEVPAIKDKLASLLVPSSLEDAYRNLGVLSSLAAEAQARSTTVGRHVEVGMTIVVQGVAHMGYISGVASELATMSPKELSQAILERRAVPC
jgi:hypothetical protein